MQVETLSNIEVKHHDIYIEALNTQLSRSG